MGLIDKFKKKPSSRDEEDIPPGASPKKWVTAIPKDRPLKARELEETAPQPAKRASTERRPAVKRVSGIKPVPARPVSAPPRPPAEKRPVPPLPFDTSEEELIEEQEIVEPDAIEEPVIEEELENDDLPEDDQYEAEPEEDTEAGEPVYVETEETEEQEITPVPVEEEDIEIETAAEMQVLDEPIEPKRPRMEPAPFGILQESDLQKETLPPDPPVPAIETDPEPAAEQPDDEDYAVEVTGPIKEIEQSSIPEPRVPGKATKSPAVSPLEVTAEHDEPVAEAEQEAPYEDKADLDDPAAALSSAGERMSVPVKLWPHEPLNSRETLTESEKPEELEEPEKPEESEEPEEPDEVIPDADTALEEVGGVTETAEAEPDYLSMSDIEMVVEMKSLCSAYMTNDNQNIEKHEPIVQEIGRELYRRGGRAEMQKVFDMLNGASGSHTLELLWVGIGNW